jgi:alpha-beta hydrolase superfamily lysophospholipase
VSQVRRSLSTAALVAVIALLAGSASAQDRAVRHACAKQGEIRFRAADGLRLAGHRFGRGKTAVIFAHEARGGACQWIPFARALARRGYLTIAFDFRGYGRSQTPKSGAWSRLPADVIAAAKFSRSLGAKKVVAVGASMGGTNAVVAGANARRMIDGVISVSAPASYGRTDALAAARRLQLPALYLVGEGDEGFVEHARLLYEATGSADKRLEILDSSQHGVLLAAEPPARSLIEAFLAAR